MTDYSQEQIRDAKITTASYAWLSLTLFQINWGPWEAMLAGSFVASLVWWHFHAYREEE